MIKVLLHLCGTFIITPIKKQSPLCCKICFFAKQAFNDKRISQTQKKFNSVSTTFPPATMLRISAFQFVKKARNFLNHIFFHLYKYFFCTRIVAQNFVRILYEKGGKSCGLK